MGAMAFSIVHTRAISGLSVLPIRVETDLANGLPSFSIVGLPNAAVREARDRVRAAITNSGFEFPQRRITVNLAPAELPKESGRFDLPIALGILSASGQLTTSRLKDWAFAGELSLTGTLLPVRGAFALIMGVTQDLLPHQLLMPQANHEEALLTQVTGLGFAQTLRDVVQFLQTGTGLCPTPAVNPTRTEKIADKPIDWSEIREQTQAKRAAVVAVSGGHNLLMMGPPGVGKSMIAQGLRHLLPKLSQAQACELASLQSLEDLNVQQAWREPPFRSPHHSTPSRALIGGGSPARPGEISLAHHGVLFLDELPEFARDTLESLREPLETGEISIARVTSRVKFPAKLMLVAAMNPCPCGYFGAGPGRQVCKCPPDRVERYRSKISGPLFDRFDLAVTLKSVSSRLLSDPISGPHATTTPEPTTQQAAAAVQAARERQHQRQGRLNAQLSVADLNGLTPMSSDSQKLLQLAAEKWCWSARAVHRVQRVSRTIADLEEAETINPAHISEAIELRRALDIDASRLS